MSHRKALLFVRARSVREPTALPLQALRKLADQRGWSVAGEFVAGPTRRRERDALVAAVHQGVHGPGIVVSPNLAQLGTTVRDVVLLVHDLLARGWDLICPGDEIDTSVPASRDAILAMIAGLATLDREGAAERARAALDQARRDGRQLGRKRREVPIEKVRALLDAGRSWREVARAVDVPVSTLHRAFHDQHSGASSLIVMPVAMSEAA